MLAAFCAVLRRVTKQRWYSGVTLPRFAITKAKTHAEEDAYESKTHAHDDACHCVDVQLCQDTRKQEMSYRQQSRKNNYNKTEKLIALKKHLLLPPSTVYLVDIRNLIFTSESNFLVHYKCCNETIGPSLYTCFGVWCVFMCLVSVSTFVPFLQQSMVQCVWFALYQYI